jgi:hypothetical protein
MQIVFLDLLGDIFRKGLAALGALMIEHGLTTPEHAGALVSLAPQLAGLLPIAASLAWSFFKTRKLRALSAAPSMISPSIQPQTPPNK